MIKTWAEIKEGGSNHYKGAPCDVEPIDLYRANGILRPWAIGEICQHALRNINEKRPVSVRDMDKIIHFAEMLKSGCEVE